MAATRFYLGADGEWIGAPMCFDTLSMSNLFNKKHIPVPLPPGWKWLMRGGQVTGTGEKAAASAGRLRIDKWKLTFVADPVRIDCTVIDIPRGATLITGSRAMIADGEDMDIIDTAGHGNLPLLHHQVSLNCETGLATLCDCQIDVGSHQYDTMVQ